MSSCIFKMVSDSDTGMVFVIKYDFCSENEQFSYSVESIRIANKLTRLRNEIMFWSDYSSCDRHTKSLVIIIGLQDRNDFVKFRMLWDL